MKETTCAFLTGIGVGGLMIVATLWLCPMGNVFSREEAVRVGHAEYYLDAKHERQWRWKEIK